MAISVTSQCIGCQACLLVCPARAIRKEGGKVTVVAHRCNECSDQCYGPHCGHICPVENALLNQQMLPLNPTGSLAADPTGLATLKSRQETIDD